MRFIADENFNGRLLAGLRQRLPDCDVIRVQDTEVDGGDDPTLLAWAASHDRIVLTHDFRTLTGYAYERVQQGLYMPGIIGVRLTEGIGTALDDLCLLIQANTPEDFVNQVRFIPLR